MDEINLEEGLETVPHMELVGALETVYDKLNDGGKFNFQVPDMEWIARQILRFESGQILSGRYADFEGKNGLQSLVYGYRIPIQSCFTRTSLWELLDGVGFEKIKIIQIEDEIGILDAHCIKPND